MPASVPVDLDRLLRLVPDPAVAVDGEGIILAANAGAERLFGTGSGTLVGRSVESMIPPVHRARHLRLREAFQIDAVTRPMGRGGSFPALRDDGSTFDAQISLTPVEWASPVVIAALRDMSERQRIERQLRERLAVEELVARIAATLVGRSGDALDAGIREGLGLVGDAVGAAGVLLYVADSPDRATVRGWWRSEGPQSGRVSTTALALGEGGEYTGTLVLHWRSSHARVAADTTRLLQVVGDVVLSALRRREVEQAMAEMALRDPLTGLANRTVFEDRMAVALARRGGGGAVVAVLFCDLDDFKVVNDTLGHPIGDAVLSWVAAHLESSVRPGDTVARVGGDEFVVLADDLPGEDAAIDIAARITAGLEQPLDVPGRPRVSASIGIAVLRSCDMAGVTVESMLQRADRAMYRAKQGGGARWSVDRDR